MYNGNNGLSFHCLIFCYNEKCKLFYLSYNHHHTLSYLNTSILYPEKTSISFLPEQSLTLLILCWFLCLPRHHLFYPAYTTQSKVSQIVNNSKQQGIVAARGSPPFHCSFVVLLFSTSPPSTSPSLPCLASTTHIIMPHNCCTRSQSRPRHRLEGEESIL